MSEERPPSRDDSAPRPDETRPMSPSDATELQRNQPSETSRSSEDPRSGDGGKRSDDRDKSVWTGRAEVRPPRRGETEQYVSEQYDADWADFGPADQQQRRWWTPIAVGTAALVLLGLLGFGIAVIVQNSGGDTESPGPAATTRQTTPPDTTAPATVPTTAASTPPTTEPVDKEVNVPALRGMPLADAKAALDRTGLTYRVIRRPSDAEPDTVIDSDPPEGRLVPSDTRVTLVVAEPSTEEPAPLSSATTTAPAGN
ncbi:PASTA domain-containing protein [Actinoplanes sp. GCM10030250]|uniref:PASTA domain-containing protein n=1 Tax=Actinoplanes sp. GCM10030250 TaxID=3273376 RepID=UPI003614CFCB